MEDGTSQLNLQDPHEGLRGDGDRRVERQNDKQFKERHPTRAERSVARYGDIRRDFEWEGGRNEEDPKKSEREKIFLTELLPKLHYKAGVLCLMSL